MAKSARKTKTGQDTSIVDGVLYFEDCSQCKITDDVFKDIIGDGYTKSIRVISLASDWQVKVFLAGGASIREDLNLEMTLRREVRSGRGHWYAYRRVFGKLHKRYVGTDENVTQSSLVEVAQRLPST